MDRMVFLAVALALLVATQAHADEWFDAHCQESRTIMASVRSAEPRAAADIPPPASQRPAAERLRMSRAGAAKARR